MDKTDAPLQTNNSVPAKTENEVLITVENVGKIFCRDLKRSLLYGVKDSISDMLAFSQQRKLDDNGDPMLRKHEFWANKGISFQLRRGQCLGLIGHNGAGKTTFLRMVNGLIKPDQGKIEIRGRVGALIALGAGFNPVLTGRENVYINGTLLGMTKAEIEAKFDDILDFADIGKFIESPIRSYSSGMRVRLGFAIASTLNTDILIVDEVLAVGDFNFKQKCLKRINKYRENGGCILFVSHNLNQLQMVCNRGVYLEKGKMRYSGEIEEASNQYFEDIQKKEEEKQAKTSQKIEMGKPSAFEIIETKISEESDPDLPPFSKKNARIAITVKSEKDSIQAFARLIILDKEQNVRISTISSELEEIYFNLEKGLNECVFRITKLPIVPANYSVQTILFEKDTGANLARKGFDNQPDYFRVANSDPSQKNLQSQYGDIVSIEISS